MPRLLRITTVPISLHLLLQGQFAYMREKGFDVVTMSADGKEVQEVVKEGAEHIVVPFTRKITPWRDLMCLIKIIREIRRLRPEIVHTHTPKAGLLGMLAAWICSVPVRLHTVAGLPLMEADGMKRWVLEIAEKITYACAHQVYPNSVGLKKFLQVELGVPDAKLKMISKGSSNGVDAVHFFRSPELQAKSAQVRDRYGIHPGDIVFSFVGRVVRDKGIVELVEAFKIIAGSGNAGRVGIQRNFFLLLVGGFEEDLDPLPAEVMTFLREDKRVVLTGFQQDIRPWIAASDVFVFPSYREGFPNVVMQSSLLGVPCIVSDINGCNEIVQHKKTGIMVPVKNVERLAEAMEWMMREDEKRKEYAAAARDFVAMNFKREVIWEELLKEYRVRLGTVGRS